MARCPDCNKFVSYEDPPEVEIQSEEISGDELNASVRVVLKCGECGTELKEANPEISVDLGVVHACPREAPEEEEEQFLLESSDAEGTSRVQDKDQKGRPIRSRRFMKTFYGADCTFDVKCTRCGGSFQVSDTAEEVASGFDDLT